MEQFKKFKFAFISNSKELAELVQRHADPASEEVITKLATMEEALPIAQQFLAEGVEVILGGGGTGSLLFHTLGQPVVKIARTHLDILRALMKARDFGKDIVLTSFARPTDGIEVFEELLSIRVRQLIFKTTEELITGITAAVHAGVSCIVGGSICTKIVISLGGNGVFVIPSKEVVLQALQEARAIAASRRKEKEDTEQLRTILETIKVGVIVIDNDGKIKIFNQMASDIFGLEMPKAIGHPLPEVIKGTGLLNVLKTGEPEIDQIRRIGNVDIVINSLPIKVDGRTKGCVATFKEAMRIQNIDRKLREKLYAKGFVARYTIDRIRSESAKMALLLEQVRKYAPTDETILIQGETGTGKEILAQSIHNLSRRKGKPFVAVNCSALPESLLESELFGYEEGAFTGARKGGKIGLFELANGGTIFLDEIADIPASLQVRLLRVLEEKELMRVGGDRIVPVDVRILSSTYKDLAREVQMGKFRIDLYFRLAVLTLHIPPLRERPEDIPGLAQELLDLYSQGRKTISAAMLQQLQGHHWIGNIRELDSLIKRYVILLDRAKTDDRLLAGLLEDLRKSHMGLRDEGQPTFADNAPGYGAKPLKVKLEEMEKDLIREALRECQFNKKRAAQKLGISVNTLWRKLGATDIPH
jgi:propionate catabolism operon transcriptional regulator